MAYPVRERQETIEDEQTIKEDADQTTADGIHLDIEVHLQLDHMPETDRLLDDQIEMPLHHDDFTLEKHLLLDEITMRGDEVTRQRGMTEMGVMIDERTDLGTMIDTRLNEMANRIETVRVVMNERLGIKVLL